MNTVESFLVSYFVNSLWQVPLLVAAAWVGARIIKPFGPTAEHRIWVGSLLCQSLLPALSSIPWEWLHIAWPWHAYPTPIREGHVLVQIGAATGSGALFVPPRVLASLAVAYFVLTLYFGARFAWRCARLSAISAGTEPLNLGDDAALNWKRWSNRLGIAAVTIASSRHIFAPVTIGVIRKRVLLPADMLPGLSPSDLDTAIAHELAHIRRNDFLKNLVYELLSLPVSYHPVFWLTRQQIMETREMVCDQIASDRSGSHEYAQSLLRLASMLLQGRSIRVPHAIGVFDANTLERRLMKLTEKKRQVGRLRHWLSIGACIALGLAAISSALTWRLGVDPEAAVDSQAPQRFTRQTVPAGKMVANILTKVPPKYPPAAKEARIQGKVVLNAVIGTSGHVENLNVVSGPEELQVSALDAVRQWTYRPVLVNGAPVEVETTITVIYTLMK